MNSSEEKTFNLWGQALCLFYHYFDLHLTQAPVNIGLCNSLASSDNKPLPEAMLSKIYVAIWHYKFTSNQQINSLWFRDAIWRGRSGSTLAQGMPCSLTAPSHYLNQCGLIICKVFTWRQFHRIGLISILDLSLKMIDLREHTFQKPMSKLSYLVMTWSRLKQCQPFCSGLHVSKV